MEGMDFLSYLAMISMGAERFTDVVKRAYIEKKFEKVNTAVYQLITFFFGFILALTHPAPIKLFNYHPYFVAILVGFAVSGGSSVWHEVLGTLSNMNKPKSQ